MSFNPYFFISILPFILKNANHFSNLIIMIFATFASDLPTLIRLIVLLHICYTDFKSCDIYYFDLVLIVMTFFGEKIALSPLKIAYIVILMLAVKMQKLGFGDLLLIIIFGLQLDDFSFLLMLVLACKNAGIYSLCKHNSPIPFAPFIISSYLLIQHF